MNNKYALESEHTPKQWLNLSKQLSHLARELESHPWTAERFSILQTTFDHFDRQAQWSASGPLARLLMTIQTALIGSTSGLSGFLGPSLNRFQQSASQLMCTTLKTGEEANALLLQAFNQLAVIAFIYLLEQRLGNWKELFPKHDPGSAKKAGKLFRELGILFLLGSKSIANIFQSIASGLNLNKTQQKKIQKIGLFEMMLLIVLLADEASIDELLESMQPFMRDVLPSIEEVIQQASQAGDLDEEIGSIALTQIQLIQLSLTHQDIEALKQAFERSFDALGLPIEDIKKDLKTINSLFNQLNLTINHIFNQSEATIANITQAA